VAEEPIRAPRTVEPTMPPELDRLIMKALARNPEERYASAQEMRAALEALIRTSGWEADTLALSTWMRELFAGKLRAQAADVAAAGLASLEDFLLTVEEKTSISWMVQPPAGGEKKTPSTGLPPSRPVSGPHPPTPPPVEAGLYDDGQTAKATELAKAAANNLVRSNANATTLKGGDPVPPMPPGAMVPSFAPLKATPTAATAGVIIPDASKSSDTPSMSLAPGDNPLPSLLGGDPRSTTAPMPAWTGADKSTAKRSAILGNLPPPMRRVIVAGSAAALVAAMALTIAFWPSKDAASTGGGVTPPPTGATTVPTTTTTGTTATPTHGGGTAARATYATLVIRVDAPAAIAVDGQAQPMGESATVNVQPGVEHIVTVQRPGHTVRRLHVPALAPGENMPLKFSVR
jgi:hypothetical protein